MATITGWAPFNIGSKNASQCWDLGHICNALTIKNTDASILIWIRLGLTPETAAAQPDGANASFPLAAGESLSLTNIRCRHIAHIAASGAPVLKGLGLLIKTVGKTS